MSDTEELTLSQQKRRCNKAQLGQLFSVHLSTIDAWIRRGCPYVQRGNLRKPWVFDALAVMEWRFGQDDPAPPIDPDRMTPPDRRAWYQSENIRRELRQADRALIPGEELEQCLQAAMAAVKEAMQSLPRKFAAAGLNAAGVLAAEQALQAELASFNNRLGDIAKAQSD